MQETSLCSSLEAEVDDVVACDVLRGKLHAVEVICVPLVAPLAWGQTPLALLSSHAASSGRM